MVELLAANVATMMVGINLKSSALEGARGLAGRPHQEALPALEKGLMAEVEFDEQNGSSSGQCGS